MQAEAYHVFRSGDSTTSLVQAGNRSISFWGHILFVDCALNKQVSSGAHVISNDRTTCCYPMQADILRILLARNCNFDIGPCYTVEAFTSVMNAYHVNHITNSLHHPQSNGLTEKCVQIVKNLFYKAKEEGKDLFKWLMIYCNTPLSDSLQSLMQILKSRSARSDLHMSNTARQLLGL